MLLKKHIKSQLTLKSSLIFLKNRNPLIWISLFAVFISLYTIIVLGLGYVLKKNNFYGQTLKPAILQNYKGVVNYFKSYEVQPQKISLDIKHLDYSKLVQSREKAVKYGRYVYTAENKGWVPATLNSNGKSFKVDLRLKGKGDHLEDDQRWSFRVKVKGSNTLFGMKRFALQKPITRGFMKGWYWNKLLKFNKLIYLRNIFVDLTVNGVHFPVYMIEENFDKRLLENNNLREGPIFWANLAPFTSMNAIDFYQSRKYKKNKAFMKMTHAAESRLEGYREGSLPLSKVFDINKMAKLFALTDLIGDYHTLQYRIRKPEEYRPRDTIIEFFDLLGRAGVMQMRFYFNPITELIEPIAYDNIGQPGATLIGTGRHFIDKEKIKDDWVWPVVLFKDKTFFKKYIQSLVEITNKKNLDRFFSGVKKEKEDNMLLLHRSHPFLISNSKKSIYKNSQRILQQLKPLKSLNAYFDHVSLEEGALYLDIANIHIFPEEILGVSLDGINIMKPSNATTIQARQVMKDIRYVYNFKASPNNIYSAESNQFKLNWWKEVKNTVSKEIATLNNTLPIASLSDITINKNTKIDKPSYLKYEKVKFLLPKNLKWGKDLIPRLKLSSRVFGTEFVTENNIIPWARYEDMFLQESKIREIKFISFDEENKLVQIDQGEWTVDQNIIIPEGYRLLVNPGTHLKLFNNSKIISYSPVEITGTKEKPVIISSENYSGQGIVVISAKGKSIIENTIFDGISSPNQAGWSMQGAVTFYESPVNLSNVNFVNTSSEDALNIIRSEFNLNNVIFRNALRDCLDIDFSHGTIKNVSFFDCGNDALDTSGSNVTVANMFFNGVGDKAVSVGEKSKVFIEKLEGELARIGVASKDMSEIFIKKAKIGNSKLGFAAYQKKSEFGPGHIKVENSETYGLEKEVLIEKGSTLIIGEEQYLADAMNVAKLLYDSNKLKLSN
jgi:hypothetical protein